MGNRLVETTSKWLARMMKGQRLTLAALERETGAPKRAALRKRMHALVDALPHARRSEPGQGKVEEFWWEWPSQERSRPEQVWALATARALLGAFNGTEIGRVLDDLLEDHRGRVRGTPAAPSDLGRTFYASARLLDPLGLDADSLDAVAQATSQQRRLRFDYTQFSGDAFSVLVEPWTLLMADEGIYLYARCVDCDARPDHVDVCRVYRVSRIQNATITAETFNYPVRAEYDPASTFAHSWGLMVAAGEAGSPPTVTLRFAPEWAAYLREQKLHPKQAAIDTADDGSITVTMTVHVTYDLVRWVRGHGNEVQVVSPANLAGWVQSGEGGSPTAYEKWVLEPARLAASTEAST